MIDEVIEEALKEVIPDEKLVGKARKVEAIIRERIEPLIKEYEGLEYRFLGSYARNTWLPESLEIDVFILFPEHYSFDELEKIGLEIGRKVVDEYELRYASHPYVHGWIDGLEVDVVPCYKLESPEKIRSAVDRTPFHHDWLKERIKGKENEVRLLKRFLKASNLYGAEYKVRGFSGYLCELLIIHYGSFKNLVENAVRWRRNMVIDVEKKEVRLEKGLENIFVIDPVDRKRNVSANLSVDNLARFVEKCRLFVENPSIDFFRPEKISVDKETLKNELEDRFVYAVVFEKPEIVEDNLYTQLEKAEKRIKQILEENDFDVLRSGRFAGSKCYLIFETSTGYLSKIKKHPGPFFENNQDAMRFLKKNTEYMTFFEGGRYFSYRVRKFRKPEEVILWAVKNEYRTMGKDVSEKIKDAEVISIRLWEIEELFEFLIRFLGVRKSE